MVGQEDATGLKPDLQLFTARPEPMTKIENCGHQSTAAPHTLHTNPVSQVQSDFSIFVKKICIIMLIFSKNDFFRFTSF